MLTAKHLFFFSLLIEIPILVSPEIIVQWKKTQTVKTGLFTLGF